MGRVSISLFQLLTNFTIPFGRVSGIMQKRRNRLSGHDNCSHPGKHVVYRLFCVSLLGVKRYLRRLGTARNIQGRKGSI